MNGKDAIRAWLGDKPTLLGTTALLAVMAAEDVAEFVRTLRRDRGYGRHLPKGDDVERWLRGYRVRSVAIRALITLGPRANSPPGGEGIGSARGGRGRGGDRVGVIGGVAGLVHFGGYGMDTGD